MPPVGNAQTFMKVAPPKAAPRPVTTTVRSAPAPSSFTDRPHGGGVFSQPRPAAAPQPASAYRNPAPSLASKIASAPKPPVRQNASQPPARVTSAISRYAAGHPFAPIATYGPLTAGPLANMRLQGELDQAFQNLKAQNLLPATAQEPALSLTQNAGPGAYEVGSGGKGGRIFASPTMAVAATTPSSPMWSWALQGLVHELAHSAQSAQTQQSIPLREGGAQAYADAVSPIVLGPLAGNDSNYSGYVQQVRKQKGPAWFMKRQFQ